MQQTSQKSKRFKFTKQDLDDMFFEALKEEENKPSVVKQIKEEKWKKSLTY